MATYSSKSAKKDTDKHSTVKPSKSRTQHDASGPDNEVLALQRLAGNQATGHLLADTQADNSSSSQAAPAGVGEVLKSPGQSMDADSRALMESRFGRDFSNVRLHTDGKAAASAQDMDASAYTVGRDIVFDNKLRDPADHMALLSHELTHVAQQDDAKDCPTPGVIQNRSLDSQADQAENSVMSGQSVQVGGAGVFGVQRKTSKEEEKGKTKDSDSEGGFWSFLTGIGRGLATAGRAVWGGIKTAGRAVWKGLKAAGSYVWKGLKAAGRAIATAAGAVWTGIKWVARQLWDKVTGIFERVGRWITRLPERVGRLLLGLWEGVKSLKPWSLEWWKSLGRASTWKKFLKWVGTRLIDLAEIAGVGEIYETVMDFVKFNTRKMASDEVSKASSVFGASLDYSLVRIDEGALIGPSFSKRPYTSFHTINSWGAMSDDTLMHELTHVWQYQQSGAIYMPQAIHAQVWGGGYNYGGIPGLQNAKNAGQGLTSFNREQQAQIVTDFYRIKQGKSPVFGSGTNADLPLYAHFVKEVSTLPVAQLLA